MNERERLVEILKNNQGDNTYYMTDEVIQKISDVLLAHGATVPPLKMGDVVYIADKYADAVHECKVYGIDVNTDKIDGTNYQFHAERRDSEQKHVFCDYDMGAYVFMERTAAEAALKGGGEV